MLTSPIIGSSFVISRESLTKDIFVLLVASLGNTNKGSTTPFRAFVATLTFSTVLVLYVIVRGVSAGAIQNLSVSNNLEGSKEESFS